MIGDEEWVVRSASVSAVAELAGTPKGIPLEQLPETLLLVCNDTDSDVRHSVLAALAVPEVPSSRQP